MPLAGKVGAIYVQTNDVPVAFTDEATTADSEKKRYKINNAAKRYWDIDTVVTVKKNGAVQTSGFTIEYAGGVVVFDSALLVGDVILVSGAYVAVTQVGGFFGWSVDPKIDVQDVTTFQSNGWKEYQATIKDSTGAADAYWGNEFFFDNLGNTMIFVLYNDSGAAKSRFECYGLISGDGIKNPLGGVVEENIKFQTTGPLYYREG